MRAALTTILLLTAALTGCATTSASNTSHESAGAVRPAKTHVEVDAEKMAAVDRAAREMGIAVHWVNPPVKRSAR